jgi:hypothetical protein
MRQHQPVPRLSRGLALFLLAPVSAVALFLSDPAAALAQTPESTEQTSSPDVSPMSGSWTPAGCEPVAVQPWQSGQAVFSAFTDCLDPATLGVQAVAWRKRWFGYEEIASSDVKWVYDWNNSNTVRVDCRGTFNYKTVGRHWVCVGDEAFFRETNSPDTRMRETLSGCQYE